MAVTKSKSIDPMMDIRVRLWGQFMPFHSDESLTAWKKLDKRLWGELGEVLAAKLRAHLTASLKDDE